MKNWKIKNQPYTALGSLPVTQLNKTMGIICRRNSRET